LNTLIVYASRYGTTAECAHMLSEKIQGTVTLCNLEQTPTVDLTSYETIVVGGPIYAGRLHKRVKQFCRDQEARLLEKRLGLFVCGMEEGEGSNRQLSNNYSPALFERAIVKESFGGQFLFSNMGCFTRKMIKLMSKTDEDVKKLRLDVIDKFAEKINA